MMMKKIPATLAVVAAAGLMLSGCVTIESEPQGSDEVPATSAPATEPAQDEGEAPADESSEPDADATEDDQESEEPDESAETVDIAGDAEGTVYARAHQAFSPYLVVWVVDEDESRIVYTERNCLGRIVEQGSGSYEDPADEDYTLITWDANPFGNGQTSRVDLTETSVGIQYQSETATTSVEAATDQYMGMCVDAGETVADFIF